MGVTEIALGVGAAAAAASAANSIANSSSGGGGGGSSTNLGMTDPSASFRGGLFGSVWDSSKGRWVQPGRGISLGNLFGTQQRQDIQSYLQGTPLNANAMGGITNILNQGASGLPAAQAQLGQDVGYAQQLAQTGFRTDVTPYANQQNWQWWNQTMPQIQEQMSGLTGAGSDWAGALGRAAAGTQQNILMQQIAADEAAANRRVQGIPLYGQLAATNASFPLAYGQDLLSLTTGARSATQAAKPGATVLDVLNQLSGQTQNNQFTQPGYNPLGGTAALASGLGQSTAALGGSLARLFGSSVGGSTGTGFSPTGGNPAQATYIYPGAGTPSIFG